MPERQVTIDTPDGVALDAVITEATTRNAPSVVLAHGITVDREEEGAFTNLAKTLASSGYMSLRFSYRGHGKSSLKSSAMTISGEMIDLKTVVDFLGRIDGRLCALVAASFGAVSTSLLAQYLEPRIRSLVYWNPVLSLRDTFVSPSTPWGKKNFSGQNVASVYENGSFKIDGEFDAGVVLWEEFHHFDPEKSLLQTKTPLLVLHGDKDSYVPFKVSERLVSARPKSSLCVVEGSDHGFPEKVSERLVIDKTVRFISEHA